VTPGSASSSALQAKERGIGCDQLSMGKCELQPWFVHTTDVVPCWLAVI